ncbi:MAG: transcriptional repressor [Firmicutes bacterium]|nr:transcriptional repressor [Bacillota bacterium]
MLRTRGLRFTPDRLRIFRALADAGKPVSVPVLISMVAEDGVNQATVYRTLEQFLAVAVVQTVLLHDGVVGYELIPPFSSHHHHFICLDCGAVQDLPAGRVDTALDKSLEGTGVRVMGHKVDIYGQCEKCHAESP